MWPNRSLLELIGTDFPIIQAPMAGASGPEMAIGVCEAGGLGSLPCAMLNAEKICAQVETVRSRTDKPFNLNFFCHAKPNLTADSDTTWKQALAPYYQELEIAPPAQSASSGLPPFDESMCEVIEECRPNVVSFHFGLPAQPLLDRVKAVGCIVLCSATTVEEARWLEQYGCDAIIAQGCEAGGHRGMFLTNNVGTQVGTMALVPQIVDNVQIPVIAAGAIADGRGIAAAFALGAAGVQIGTAFLFTPESLITDLHRDALRSAQDDQSALTNLFSGRPARGLMNRVMREVGPISDRAPAFPTAGAALAPLKAKAESQGLADFSSLWSGQAAGLGREIGSKELTIMLAKEAEQCLNKLSARDSLS